MGKNYPTAHPPVPLAGVGVQICPGSKDVPEVDGTPAGFYLPRHVVERPPPLGRDMDVVAQVGENLHPVAAEDAGTSVIRPVELVDQKLQDGVNRGC